jgi:hypothetical protein
MHPISWRLSRQPTLTILPLQSSAIPQVQMNMSISFKFSPSEWQAPLSVQHPYIDQIRQAVSEYRLQSAAHFSTAIEVCQATHYDNPDRFADVDHDFVLCVGFYNFGTGPTLAACRPKTQKRGRKKLKVLKEQVEVCMQNKFIPLKRFLRTNFPIYDGPVGDEVMFQWWCANGQTFNWKDLPTELKERVLQFCMHRSPPPTMPNKPRGREAKDAPEVTGQFGKWASLLSVSHQVRAICLRLCFVGSSDLDFSNGLCIVAKDFYAFKCCIRRLGKHRQMTKANGVPTDDKAWELEKTYKSFPKIYPHLDRYATFGHGIRKIHLQFSFLDSLQFFKVTAGSFEQHWRPYHLDFEIFEQLPHLNELIIELPDAKGFLEDNSRQPVRLFYGEPFNCPRILHRLIYERAAEVLARYKDVKIHGFIDEEEGLKFLELRDTATNGLKITTEELEELYGENLGGIELDESVEPGVEKKEMSAEERDVIHDDFWPPKCRCEILCRGVLHPNST